MYVHCKGIVLSGWSAGPTRDAQGRFRAFATGKREALWKTAWAWHSRYLRLHFRAGAPQKYDYKPRTARYLRRKRRKLGGTPPLTWSGLMRRMLQQFPRITKTQRHAVIRMTAPRYVRQVGSYRGGNHPPLGEEALRTTPQEARELSRVFRDTLIGELNNDRTRRRVKV